MFAGLLLSALRHTLAYRGDGAPNLIYFQPEDYGVTATDFSFRSGKNLLRGKRLVPNGEPRGVIVFHHGLGAGYSAYTQMLAGLVKRGFLVYAYDNTGCMTSEGRTMGFFPQSLLDQAAFFSFLEKEEAVKGLPRYVMGHSWGGYTALGALNPDYHVAKIVSISGFVSLKNTILEAEPKMRRFEGLLQRSLRKGYGKYGVFDGFEAIAKSEIPILYVQGEKDTMVSVRGNHDELKKRFPNKKDLHLILVPGAGHNPYWTKRGQDYYRLIREKYHALEVAFDNGVAIDYSRLCEEDPDVMRTIYGFLEA